MTTAMATPDGVAGARASTDVAFVRQAMEGNEGGRSVMLKMEVFISAAHCMGQMRYSVELLIYHFYGAHCLSPPSAICRQGK